MPSDDDLKEVAKSLDRIAKLLAGVLLKEDEGPEHAPRPKGEQQRKIKRLKQHGFDNSEIAKMRGTTANTVGVAVHSLKKGKRRKKKSR